MSLNFGKRIFRVNRSCFMLSSTCRALGLIYCVVCVYNITKFTIYKIVVNSEFPAELFFKTLSICRSVSLMVMINQKQICSYLTVAHSSTSRILRVQCVKCTALSATESKPSY